MKMFITILLCFISALLIYLYGVKVTYSFGFLGLFALFIAAVIVPMIIMIVLDILDRKECKGEK